MMNLSVEEIKENLKKYQMVPVFREIFSDTQTPVRIYNQLSQGHKNTFILESVDNNQKWGRYSFIGIDPKLEIVIKNHTAKIIYGNSSETKTVDDPIQFISEFIEKNKMPKIADAPALMGGLVGYFGYDTVRYIEKKLVYTPDDDIGLADCNLFLYDEIIAFDHLCSKIVIIENVRSDSPVTVEQQLKIIDKRVNDICEKISSCTEISKHNEKTQQSEVSSTMDKTEFCKSVMQAKEHIINGDIFQIVLSQRFEISNPPDSFCVYRMLRSANPSPYLYYFKNPDYCIAGASPEMLVNVTDSVVTTKPIAGTMPRGENDDEDKKNAEKLISDHKECSEHTMLVDLGRNDIGKVSEYGSVEVSDFMHIERYSKVMHIVSDVHGKLRHDKTSVDALMAVLPAGTLSGAPKVRAMELIDKFEKNKRCLYGGTIGYLVFDGNRDTSKEIRTILYKNDKAYIQAGAGIVADSVPEKEYTEIQNKASAMINAIKEAASL